MEDVDVCRSLDIFGDRVVMLYFVSVVRTLVGGGGGGGGGGGEVGIKWVFDA